MKTWVLFLLLSVLLGVTGVVVSTYARNLIDNARDVAKSKCFTKSGVMEVVPLTIESNVNLKYTVKQGNLYLVIDGLYEEQVARFSGENVVVLNRDLWDVFFIHCASTTANRIREEASRLATLALGFGISGILFAVLGVVNLARRKR